MQHRPLGRTGLNVSLICLGTMTWGEQNTEAQAHEQLDHAVASDINFIDTA
jgi:aryl-alcohol dehydrogenase-like predicted oxidoreductase